MNRSKEILQFIKSISLPSIYLIGGLIFITWFILTPSGVFGKADAIGYAVCHRIDSRSFHIGTMQLPLCVRCTGQYLGAAIGLCYLAMFGKRKSGTPPKLVIAGMVLIGIVFLIDGLNSYLFLPPFLRLFPKMPHLYVPSNALRLFTGTGMGLVIAIVLYPAFWSSIISNPDSRPAVDNLSKFIILICMGILVDILVLTQSGFILLPAAIISTAGVVLLLTLVYTILWIRILGKENQFTGLSQITVYFIAGLLTAIIQIALFDLIRYIITGTWNGLIFN
jgi:uncharacterized membrane protein